MTQTRQTSLPLRNDTILGVCEAIGEDFGFNANWLRLAFASLVYFSPVAVIGAYLGLGVVVAAARWAFPSPSADALQASRPQATAEKHGQVEPARELVAA